ncbi:MAG: ABC transporter ATP-binding protein [candidate division KSB1 bacterium]|nr:ABC transporter ATP-binding protein [candidate division KSB1 bacterium]
MDMQGNGTLSQNQNHPSPNRVSYRTLFRIYRVFARSYKKHWRMLAWAYAGLLMSTALSLLAPWPLKLILDYVILGYPLPEQAGFVTQWISDSPESLLLALAVAFFVIRFTQSFVSYLYKIGAAIVGSRMVAEFRERLFNHLQGLSLSFHAASSSGDIVYRLTNDISQVRMLLIRVPQQLIQRSLVMISYIGMMTMLNVKLSLIAFSVIPVIYYFNRRFGVGVQEATLEKRSKESEVTSIITENITTMALIQAYGLEESQQMRFAAENQQSLESGVRALKYSKLYRRVNSVLISIGTSLVLYFGGNLALDGVLLPGTVVLFVSYLKNLYGPLDKFAEMLLGIARSQVACDRLLELLECDMVIEDAKDARPAPPFKGKVEFKDVSFAYIDNEEVLKNINFVVQPGETVALVGYSGAGKSTLISLLLRFYDPQTGEIRIDGANVRRYELKSLRNQITILLQDAPLFNMTVRENIAFGKFDATEEEIITAAKRAQAHEFILQLPKGYDTRISEGGSNLSGGQRQRINIARAIIRNTPIVILDEPVSALDAETEAKVNQAIHELTNGKTTFIVAHKFSTIVRADKILVLEKGELVGFGRHEELLETSPVYRELFELQVGEMPLPA